MGRWRQSVLETLQELNVAPEVIAMYGPGDGGMKFNKSVIMRALLDITKV
jgi:hypothetical protein